MISEQEKAAFWAIVAECLVRYYGFDREAAIKKSSRLRKNIESDVSPIEMVYHAEPLDVASDLAGEHDNGKTRTRVGEDYLQLLSEFETAPAP